MNIIERQTVLGKSLFEINSNTFTDLATAQRENVEKYFAALRDFGNHLPEIKDIASFVSFQSEYNESLWNTARNTYSVQSGIIRSAFEDTRDAVRTAFAGEAVSEETEAEIKPKTKAKKAEKISA